MNWFDILKNAGLAQRQRQGISARQKDEEFIFEDDEEDCTQKIIDEYIRLCQKFYGKTPRKLNMFGAAKVYYKIGDGSSLRDSKSMLKIKFPKTNEQKEAYCAFYNKFAQGRNFYPPNPEVKQFYNDEWKKANEYNIWTQTERKDWDSPTSNFNYNCVLFDRGIVFENSDKIELRFKNVPEDAWK